MPISGGPDCEHPVTSAEPPFQGRAKRKGLTECLSCHAFFENARPAKNATFTGDLLLEGLGATINAITQRQVREIEDVGVVKRATKFDDGAFDVTTVGGTGFILAGDRKPPEGMTLRPGDKVRLHLTNGSSLKGVYVSRKTSARVKGSEPVFMPWQRVFHFTDDEFRAESVGQMIKWQREKAERFEQERPKLDADFAALPDTFKQRIIVRRVNNPTFRAEYEAYEMFTCVEAVVLTEHLRPRFDAVMLRGDVVSFVIDNDFLPATADKDEIADADDRMLRGWVARLLVLEFDKRPWKEQDAVLSDQHSGNTHGMALTLAAYALAGWDDYVVGIPAASAPLVGSEAVGDVPREAAVASA